MFGLLWVLARFAAHCVPGPRARAQDEKGRAQKPARECPAMAGRSLQPGRRGGLAG